MLAISPPCDWCVSRSKGAVDHVILHGPAVADTGGSAASCKPQESKEAGEILSCSVISRVQNVSSKYSCLFVSVSGLTGPPGPPEACTSVDRGGLHVDPSLRWRGSHK